jgi:predicted 3-demethylubiquinone-9 3-methyltransferase (glyoxalase superfamily)
MWEKLSAGGKEGRCGWLVDKFGLSWQIVPPVLGELLKSKDGEKSKRVMQALFTMNKIDIGKLKQAYAGQ